MDRDESIVDAMFGPLPVGVFGEPERVGKDGIDGRDPT